MVTAEVEAGYSTGGDLIGQQSCPAAAWRLYTVGRPWTV